METFIVLLISASGIGIGSAAVASAKGRSVPGWFCAGFFPSFMCIFPGIIFLIMVAVLPNVKEEQARREAEARERHRLREQLRQEQIKSETYRRYATVRLDAHDQALGVDTRGLTALPGASPANALPSDSQHQIGPDAAPPSPLDELAMAVSQPGMPTAPGAGQPPAQAKYEPPIWYYEELGQPRGPITASALKNLALSGVVVASTLVWCEALGDWTPASRVPSLSSLVR